MKFPKTSKLVVILLAANLLAVVSVGLAQSSVFEQLDLLVDIRHEIVSRYVEEADEQKMIVAAVRGMIDSLEDPFTVFLSPDDVDDFQDEVQARFSGIGAEITIDKNINRLRIVNPLEDSPAWRAGVMPGDIVLEVDGTTTEDMNLREAQKLLKGEADTTVKIKVRHETGEEAMIEITRAVIKVSSVRGFRVDADNKPIYMLDPVNKIGFVKVRQFTDRTGEELRQAMDQLAQQDLRGLILDLRFNPGGLLTAAVDVADMFLDGGKTIVSVQGRTVPKKVEMSTSPDMFGDMAMVILANESSASGAEVVAGALTDNGRAKFIGMRTYGKSSVQPVRQLVSGQGAIKITTAYYYLPKGRKIHRQLDSEVWGVDPEDGFFVPMSPKQNQKMQEVYLENKVLRQITGPITPQWIEEEMADPQLAAGLGAILGKLESGEWSPVGESGANLLARRSQREQLKRRRDLILESLERVNKELAKLDQPDDEPESESVAAENEPANASP